MKKFTFYNLLPGELAVVTTRSLRFMEAFVEKDVPLKAAYDLIVRNLDTLETALSKDQKSPYTIRLLEKDVDRDNAFIGFRDLVKAYLRNPDKETKDAARAILDIIQKYGFTLYKLPVVVQTSVMNLLITELKQPGNLQAIRLLGTANEWFNYMETATNEYEELRQEKVDEETRQEYKHLRVAFRELGSDLKDLIKFLALLKKANYSPELPGIISSIEKEISDAMALARGRETRRENSQNNRKEPGE